MDFAGLDIFAIPIKMGDLTAMGKKNKIINFSAGPNFTDFQMAMGLFDSLGLRGGKASPRLSALMQFVFEQ